jgi:hypothetical protein
MADHADPQEHGVCNPACRDRLGYDLYARPEWRRHASGVNAGPIPLDLVVLAKPSQYRLMDTLPNSRQHPSVKPTPATHPTAAAELTWQVLSRNSSLENKQNAGQRCPVIDARSATFWRWTVHRQLGFDKRPELVRSMKHLVWQRSFLSVERLHVLDVFGHRRHAQVAAALVQLCFVLHWGQRQRLVGHVRQKLRAI